MNSEAINSSIDSLKAVYTVLLALSLGQAFSELVDTEPHGAERIIRQDRILNLIPFLLLIIPFIQGMDRYFFDVYKTPARPSSYGGHLLLDCLAFTLEGSLFFVLARSLAKLRWLRFYKTVMALLILDAVWGAIVWKIHLQAIPWWIILDIIAVVLIAAVIRTSLKKLADTDERKKEIAWNTSLICLFIILARTIADYYTSWKFYFPPS